MKVEQQRNADGEQVVTITVSAGDDPIGVLNGLAIKGRLETFLRALGRPGDLSWIADADEMWEALTRVGFVTETGGRVLEGLMVAAREDHGLSYGRIALALDLPRQTVVDRIERTRRARSSNTTQEEA